MYNNFLGNSSSNIAELEKKHEIKADGFLEAIEHIRDLKNSDKDCGIPKIALERIEKSLLDEAINRGYC